MRMPRFIASRSWALAEGFAATCLGGPPRSLSRVKKPLQTGSREGSSAMNVSSRASVTVTSLRPASGWVLETRTDRRSLRTGRVQMSGSLVSGLASVTSTSASHDEAEQYRTRAEYRWGRNFLAPQARRVPMDDARHSDLLWRVDRSDDADGRSAGSDYCDVRSA